MWDFLIALIQEEAAEQHTVKLQNGFPFYLS